MGLLTLLRRRMGTHVLAVVAVVIATLMSMIVVATLQLLSGAISDAGVRTSLASGNRADRTITVVASVRPGTLAEADRTVRQRMEAIGGELEISRVAYLTARGITGADATARAQVADVTGLRDRADLVSGAWPTAGAGSGSAQEVVLPVEAAAALDLTLGEELALPSLVNESEKDLVVRLVGTYRPRDPTAAVWIDDPLSLSGVQRSEYTTFGPFVLADGVFESGAVGPSPITWRAGARFDDATVTSISDIRDRLTTGLAALREVVGDDRDAQPGATATPSPIFSNARVETTLPGQLDDATVVAQRIRASLLTPTVLLILLGASSLVMAARLLVGLRADETRLMRTRGLSTGQLVTMALADAGFVVGLGAVGAVVVAPFLTRVIARAADVSLAGDSVGEAVREPGLWIALATMALLATLVIVLTALRSGAGSTGLGRAASAGGSAGAGGVGSRLPAVLQVVSGGGLDLALVGIGVLAVLQLRRYDVVGSTTVDPLTIAAPACVVAGLAVLCLRLLPGATRQVERVSVGHVGLDRAWGAWQLSRRLAAQGGTILLILLCVSMGALALAHSATAGRALADQSAFEAGASVRVDGTLGRPLAERVAGGSDRAMPVLRETSEMRSVADVTVLGVDATTAGRVMSLRPDALGGRAWSSITDSLARQRPDVTAVTLPTGTKELTFRTRFLATAGSLEGFSIDNFGLTGQVLVRDARGYVTSLPLGTVTSTSRAVALEMPQGDLALAEPVSLLGFTMTLPDFLRDTVPGLVLGMEATDVRADGTPVPGTDLLTDRSQGVDLRYGVAAPAVRSVPVVMTRDLASALDLDVGGTLGLPVAGRNIPAKVDALVDVIPTATDPTRAILLDLPTFYATTGYAGTELAWPSVAPVPREWWLAPTDGPRAATALREAGVLAAALVVRDDVEAGRRSNPVNAGMQAAMLLVTGAALVLAAVGFAATTASLARARHHDNAILLALGMPPGRIRRILTLERVCIVGLTVLVGVAMGAAAAWVVVPFLVGGDGHAQVPSVLVVIPWGALAGLAAVVIAVLGLLGVLVLRRTGGDIASELRMGESR
ncbi:FtsX-like permease family protein [Knoellia subterranea]|uniref:ABC3 transporter permease C-terminal domain-containing protein n=1 Tax=Knoellia subterranea KCTC 19937 TaxID=1385521 RepID=A0A0A0JVC4_9MICO|nr:FtsX-like permease family protein [Knoellia subterranea]KGN39576.1 hypothetical protein N803_01445 [Knoellia subterranea KCTC 19937]